MQGYSDEYNILWNRFQQIDTDRSGTIEWAELQRALRERGYDFKDDTVRAMIRLFDADGTSKLNFEQFVHLNEFVRTRQRQFQRWDAERSGDLSRNELQSALGDEGFQFTQQAWQWISSGFDRYHTGRYGFDSFVEVFCFCSIARNLFRWKDEHGRNAITIGFDEWVYLAALMR